MAQGFPEAEGLRVLVVEDDPARQNTLYKNFHNWNYSVRMCKRAEDALNLIRQEKEEFHILITASNVSDMDGFTFVEQVRRLKPDLPIIILMSRDGDMNKIRKMVELGGCDFLWKPMRVKELRERMVLQQGLSRKRNNNNNNNKEEEASTSTATAVGEEYAASRKRKQKEKVVDESASVKKPRLTWTKELHQKFVDTVNMIGLKKASPTKIRANMNAEGLTREQLSSHLQKYRDYLNKKGKKKKAAADNGETESQIGVMTCSNSLAPLQHNLVINQNCNIAPVPAAPSFEVEVSMQMKMQRGGERVGFGHSMSYNDQQLMLLQQHDNSTNIIPPPTNWNWNWNGAAAAAGPSSHLHFQRHQWSTVPAVSHINPGFSSNHLYCNSSSVEITKSKLSSTPHCTTGVQNHLNNMSYDTNAIEKELAAAVGVWVHDADPSGYSSAADNIFPDLSDCYNSDYYPAC